MTQSRNAPREGLWLTLSDLAAARGITKGPLSRRVTRLEDQGLLTTRPGPHATKLINVAEFDRAIGAATDAVRELNGNTRKAARGAPAPAPGEPILALEMARRAAYEADLKKLDLDKRLAELVPTEDVHDAFRVIAETAGACFDQLPTLADELAAAVARDGVQGARLFLKTMAHDLRVKIAGDMKRVEAEARAKHDGESEEVG